MTAAFAAVRSVCRRHEHAAAGMDQAAFHDARGHVPCAVFGIVAQYGGSRSAAHIDKFTAPCGNR